LYISPNDPATFSIFIGNYPTNNGFHSYFAGHTNYPKHVTLNY
jgi:hypothetical protein